MTYIDYLNRFHLWIESNAMPAASQLMYFKLLHVFNRAGWPESVQVDNRRMEVMMEGMSLPAIVRARDKLIAAGFIGFRKVKKGCPNRYYLRCVPVFTGQGNTRTVTQNSGKNNGENVTPNVPENVAYIKNKNKNKTRRTPPKPPEGVEKAYDLEELGDLLNFSLPPGWNGHISD